jgi:hypothetical protein
MTEPMSKMTVKPSLDIVRRRGEIYVRQHLRIFQDGKLAKRCPPEKVGPFRDLDEAERFIAQRAKWLIEALIGLPAEPPPFVFDASDPRVIEQLLESQLTWDDSPTD